MIQFKGVCFMWFKVAIFHAEQHTLLIQSLQQGILCVFTSFSCDSSSLMWLDLESRVASVFFLSTAWSTCWKEEAGYARPARPLFHAGHYRFQYMLKAIMPCTTKEWSGHARLQPVLHGLFFFWDHYFTPLAATMARWWQWQKQWSSCSLAVNLAKYLYNISS